jgi:Spy/CpxP family protein refolding chaperone
MRKTIIMGLGLALSLAGTAAAQQPGQDAPPRPKAEGERGDKRGRLGPEGFLFRDITLTDAQKTQLQALRKTERDQMDARRDERKKQFDEVKAARERGDTAAARAIMQRNRQHMEQARDQHIAAVRNILTADQRVQFDKNVAEFKQRQAERGDRVGPRGKRGPRGAGVSRGAGRAA